MGRSRGGFTTKLHLVTDRRGLPLAVVLTPGQRHDSTQFEQALNAVGVRQRSGQIRCRPRCVLADRGYDVDRIRAWLRRKGIAAVIPSKRNRKRPRRHDRALYRERNVVERTLGHLKEHRRIGTRHEKLAESYRAMVQLAIVERYLREYPDRA
ncbi:MAG: IS5 family transposase [Myxococcota bacterium]